MLKNPNQRAGNQFGLGVLLLGGLLYFHVSKGGYVMGVSELYAMLNNKTEQEVRVTPDPSKVKKPEIKYVKTLQDVNAYETEDRSRVLGIIQANVTLPILDTLKRDNGKIVLVKTKTNGLNVWIEARNLEFKRDY